MPPCSGRSRPSLQVVVTCGQPWPLLRAATREIVVGTDMPAVSSNKRIEFFWSHKKPLVHHIRRAQVLPALGREVIEGQQCIEILDEALDRLLVLDAPGL